MSVTFDPVNRYVLVNTPITEISALTIYSEAMDWSDSQAGMAYPIPMEAVGKQALRGGIFSDSIFSFINSWKLKFWSITAHSFTAIDNTSTKLTAESTVGGDTTQTVTIHGYDSAGNVVQSDAITLNGVTPVDIESGGGDIDFTQYGFCSGIYYVILSGVTAGNVLIKDSLGTTVVTLTAGQLTARDSYQARVTGTVRTDDGSPISSPPDLGYVELEYTVTSQGIWLDEEAIAANIANILATQVNRMYINTNNNTLTIYEADGTTPKYVFNLKDSGGSPATQNVYERDPQ